MSESTFTPDWFSKPGDTLSRLLEKQALSPRDLADRMNADVATVHGLLSGTLPISGDLSVRLARAVGGSPSFWENRQEQFDRDLDHAIQMAGNESVISWARSLPLGEMVNAGWMSRPADAKTMAKAALTFFDVSGPDEWRDRYAAFSNSFSFRTSPSFESKLGALSAWLRQGELEADTVRCAAWNPDKFRTLITDIRRLTLAKSPSYFMPRLRNLCAQAGVAIVFVKAPAGCRASGASRFIDTAKKALIILSFRFLSDDHFWFTFFHEAGHLLLHGEHSTFIDGGAAAESEKEADADRFAASVLIPPARQDELMNLRPTTENVMRFSLSVGISRGVVVGQMQHRKLIGPNQLNRLKRRYNWEEIVGVLNRESV